MVGVQVRGVHALEPLWELHERHRVAVAAEHEADARAQRLRVVDVVVAVQVEDEGRVGDHGGAAFSSFMAPAFFSWLNPGRFSWETYTSMGFSRPSSQCVITVVISYSSPTVLG